MRARVGGGGVAVKLLGIRIPRLFVFGKFREIKRPKFGGNVEVAQILKANQERVAGKDVKSLRRQLEDAVARGDRDEAKKLTRETFDAMGVRSQ